MSALCSLPSATARGAACLDEAIRRTVARAIETGELLEVAAEAGRLAAACPEIASAGVADLLIRAGVEARINLALGPESGAPAGRQPAASQAARASTVAARRTAR